MSEQLETGSVKGLTMKKGLDLLPEKMETMSLFISQQSILIMKNFD